MILLLHDPIYFKEKNINLDMQKDFAKVIICFLLQSSKWFSVIYSLNKYLLNAYTMRSSPPQQYPWIFQQPQVITFPLKVKQRGPINFASCQLTRKVNKKMMIFFIQAINYIIVIKKFKKRENSYKGERRYEMPENFLIKYFFYCFIFLKEILLTYC